MDLVSVGILIAPFPFSVATINPDAATTGSDSKCHRSFSPNPTALFLAKREPRWIGLTRVTDQTHLGLSVEWCGSHCGWLFAFRTRWRSRGHGGFRESSRACCRGRWTRRTARRRPICCCNSVCPSARWINEYSLRFNIQRHSNIVSKRRSFARTLIPLQFIRCTRSVSFLIHC